MERNTLSADERIKNSNEITTLIREGRAFFLAPFKVYYSWTDDLNGIRVRAAFAVPKRKFGKAVMRNRLKRLTRESFRLQKSQLDELTNKKKGQLNILFMYQQTKVMTYQEIYTALGKGIKEIIKRHG